MASPLPSAKGPGEKERCWQFNIVATPIEAIACQYARSIPGVCTMALAAITIALEVKGLHRVPAEIIAKTILADCCGKPVPPPLDPPLPQLVHARIHGGCMSCENPEIEEEFQ